MTEYVVYSKEDCAACTLAKNLLEQKQVDHSYLVLDTDYDLEHLMEVCASLGIRPSSFPIIVKVTNNNENDSTLNVQMLQEELKWR